MRQLESCRVLITGAGGFIGSHLVRALSERGARLCALVAPRADDYQALPNQVVGAFGEIADSRVLGPLVSKVDTVIHLAGPASVSASFENPLGYLHTHVIGTATLMEACRAAPIKRVILLSSGEVYGQPVANPVTEEHLLQPKSPYAAAKVGSEALVQSYAMTIGFDAVILRVFSAYGPGLRRTSIVGTVLSQALESASIQVHDLRPVRDYCFVGDVTEAVILSCTQPLVRPVSIYNVGSQKGVSVAELAALALEVAGRKVPIQQSLRRDRPDQAGIHELISDARCAARELRWHARTNLKQGLSLTLTWLKQVTAL